MSGQIRPCILVVDYRPRSRKCFSDLLSSQYDCETVASGEEALKQLRAREFQLLICDITMPGMSGLETLPKAKCISPNCVVIMISGIQTVESAIDALRLGAFDYLMKPFDLRQVEAVVERALEHQNLIVAKQRYENHLEELVEQRTKELDHALNSGRRLSLNLESLDLGAGDERFGNPWPFRTSGYLQFTFGQRVWSG